MRTSVLGGEVTRRGLLGAVGKPGYAALAVAVLAAILLWLSVGGLVGAALAFNELGGVLAVVYPWSGRRPLVVRWLWAWRFRVRRRAGEHQFVSAATTGASETGARWELPTPLGRVAPVDLNGTGHDELFLLRHNNPGETEYLSVLLEVQGQASGIRSERAYESASIRYGVMLAELAREGSFIRGLQQLNRIVPHDPVLHRSFIGERLSRRPGLGDLVSSYEDLIEKTAHAAEQHRNYLVARIPLTTQFFTEASAHAPGVAGWAALVREELARLVDLAARAELARPRVLGEQRTCAVLRSLQDPDFAIDHHEGVRWANCWQSYVAEATQLVVNGRWYTRVAILARDGISAVPLGPHWLRPLLTRVSPAVIRTLSVRMEFVPARVARARAIKHVAEDGAAMLGDERKGRIDDGTGQVMLSASRQRLKDLAPGSGHHGVDWSMAISVTARDPAELRRACMRIQNEAANSALNHLDWQDAFHDASILTTYPLARGLAVTR